MHRSLQFILTGQKASFEKDNRINRQNTEGNNNNNNNTVFQYKNWMKLYVSVILKNLDPS